MGASTVHLPIVCSPIPRGEKRRREIAAVAEQVFFETGFADTTMQAIAIRAGASKETLYRHFGSKEELFAEVVAARARSFLEGLDERFEQPGTVADVLHAVGCRIPAATARGELRCPDAGQAARIFLGAVLTNIHLTWLVLQHPPLLPRLRMRVYVDEVVAIFMGRYAVAG